ncbi:related to tRNA (guanine-N(1)-)-methyltransferase [Phialocephala subalpina]|uniref:tRNA (guanine(9)-N1)-methyltransferase n=1 Tax=Phialocephala subalpina TaxID=576137 RepID=A0A1L7WXH8_9HELO|nr:related to tRNA (guanine-N(1)-)-methyltransferase [Phialocephala subalpina]
MAESEERPSKIRKMNPSEDTFKDFPEAELSQASPEGSGSRENQIPEVTQEDQPQTADGGPPLSKNARKKLERAARWEAGKDYRRLKRREKHKEKKARKAEAREEAEAAGIPVPEPEVEKKTWRRPVQVPVSLIIDCNFDQLMTESELISLSTQLTRSYSENRKNPFRSHLAISSWGGRIKERFETVLTRNHESWKGVTFYEEDFVGAAEKLDGIMRSPAGGKLVGALAGQYEDEAAEVPTANDQPRFKPSATAELAGPPEAAEAGSFEQPAYVVPEIEEPALAPPEESIAPSSDASITDSKPPSIIYLTSDSDDTLTDLEPNTSYIIGGIVDKNRHKGICYRRACERDIRTAKLPIGEYLEMGSRKVLAVNHVVEIMLKWLECGDWGKAFLRVIPERKGAKLRGSEGDGEKVRGKREKKGRGRNGERKGEQEENEGSEDDEGGAEDDVEMKDDASEAAEAERPVPPIPEDNLESNAEAGIAEAAKLGADEVAIET